MNIIALWAFKKLYKKKIQFIKNQNPSISDKLAIEKLLISEGKSKFLQILKINVILLILIAIPIIIAITIIFISAFNFTSVMATISGNAITQLLENKDDGGPIEESSWRWDKIDNGNGDISGPGGLYPKDKKLRLRAELIEILQKSSNDAKATTGVRIEPAWALGTIYRETGVSLYTNMDNNKISSLYKDLIIVNPICGQGSSCLYSKNGVSHFVGGHVTSGIDKGDPYKQAINISKSDYDKYKKPKIGHATGYIQFESPYVYGRLNKLYGDPKIIITDGADINKVQSQLKMDNSLGFARPNILYIPDSMYNGVFSLAGTPTINGSNYRNIIESSDFKSLSEYNQNYLKFVYASAGYGRGHITESDDEMILALIKVAKSGKIQYLDDMIMSVSGKYWNSSSMASRGDKNTFVDYINNTYGLGIPSDRVSWYGVYAGCVGKVAYTEMIKAISMAEKEQIPGGSGSSNGNWIGKPGSGQFGNSGSQYYLSDIGIRWYLQSSKVTTNSSTWGNIKIQGTTYTKTPYPLTKDGNGKQIYNSTLASGGCGIYTIAMIASNILNKDITPDVALAALEGKHQASCLVDSGVPVLAAKLGLKSKTINYNSSDIIDRVKAELAKGNMILFVSDHGPYPWYNGDGHFMAIRGITDDGKLLGISSVGNGDANMTAQELMKTPISPEIWLKSLSTNRNYVWTVGLNVE